jgi:hypothetical protein
MGLAVTTLLHSRIVSSDVDTGVLTKDIVEKIVYPKVTILIGKCRDTRSFRSRSRPMLGEEIILTYMEVNQPRPHDFIHAIKDVDWVYVSLQARFQFYILTFKVLIQVLE